MKYTEEQNAIMHQLDEARNLVADLERQLSLARQRVKEIESIVWNFPKGGKSVRVYNVETREEQTFTTLCDAALFVGMGSSQLSTMLKTRNRVGPWLIRREEREDRKVRTEISVLISCTTVCYLCLKTDKP